MSLLRLNSDTLLETALPPIASDIFSLGGTDILIMLCAGEFVCGVKNRSSLSISTLRKLGSGVQSSSEKEMDFLLSCRSIERSMSMLVSAYGNAPTASVLVAIRMLMFGIEPLLSLERDK